MGIVAVVGFTASLLVHIAAYVGDSLSYRTGAVWLLHVGVFAVFVPAVIFLSNLAKSGGLGAFVARFPKGIIACAVAIHIYASFAGVVGFTALRGSPVEQGAGYALMDHGVLVRELSREEFIDARAVQDRGFSAIWLSFYGVSALFWLFRPSTDAT